MCRGIFAGLWLGVCLVVISATASAQVEEKRFEVGSVLTVISLTDFQTRLFPTTGVGNNVVTGLGGRLTFNFDKHFAIDAEASFFPEAHLNNEEFGQKLQGFIGVKAGVRKKRVGVFAKARPGVMWFGEFPMRGSCTTTSFGSVCGVAHEKDFAMDIGGVVEFYPADRAIIRADIGDTIISYPMRTFGQFNNLTVLNAQTKNNLQISVGFGWRF
jgi:Outer membrane protein beta-barrel domain